MSLEEEVKQLFEQGFGAKDIADKLEASLNRVKGICTAFNKGFASRAEYKEHLAKKKGFASRAEYREHLAKQRAEQRKPANKNFSKLLKGKLKESGYTRSWLAEQLQISESTVSNYISGYTIPKPQYQQRIFQLLNLPYKTIDDIV